MYEIWVESEVFAGKRTLQQHRLVNEVPWVLGGRGVLVGSCDHISMVAGTGRRV